MIRLKILINGAGTAWGGIHPLSSAVLVCRCFVLQTVTELCQPTPDWALYANQMAENRLMAATTTPARDEDQLSDEDKHATTSV